MTSATVNVEEVQVKNGKKGEYTLIRGNGQKFFVGNESLRSQANSLSPGDSITIHYREGNYGPIVTGLGDNAPAPSRPQEPTVEGMKMGFVARWVLDIEIATGAKFTEASLKKSAERALAVIKATQALGN